MDLRSWSRSASLFICLDNIGSFHISNGKFVSSLYSKCLLTILCFYVRTKNSIYVEPTSLLLHSIKRIFCDDSLAK